MYSVSLIMKEIIRTNNLVLISKILSVLNDAGIKNDLLDTYTSTVEGSISAIQKRIVVSASYFKKSKKIINALTNLDENK